MKAAALDDEYGRARPKHLRFAIFNHVGKVVQPRSTDLITLWREVLEAIVGPGPRRLSLAAWSIG